MSARAWGAVVPWLGLAACANVWGLEDLGGSDGGRTDATATTADPPDGTGADGETAVGDSADPDGSPAAGDAAPARDASDPSQASDAPVEAEGGALTDAMVTCQAHCPDGCCDSTGTCQTAEAISACGKGGAACQDCTQTSCWPISPCCSPSSKACACDPKGVCP